MLSPIEIFERWNEPNTGSSMIIIGSSKAGKTVYLLNMLHIITARDKNVIPIFIVGNPNAPVYSEFREKFPFFEGLDNGGVQIIETCKQINSSIEIKHRYNFLFVLDDLVTGMRNASTISNLLLSYRNSGLSCICLLQNSTLLIKNARLNASCYLYGMSKAQEIEFILKNFGIKMVGEFELIKKMDDKIKKYKELTNDHKFIAYFPLQDETNFLITKGKM